MRQFLLACFIAGCAIESVAAACDAGWDEFESLCYKYANTTSSWYEAEAWCYDQHYGSHSASIHSAEQAEWLAAKYVDSKGYMIGWTGLRRNCDNTTYAWTDGSPYDFQFWSPGSPQSNHPEQSCVTIWVTGARKPEPVTPGYIIGMLDDLWQCGNPNLGYAMCKYDPASTAPHIPYVDEWCTTPVPTTMAPTTTPLSTPPPTTTPTTTTPTTTTPTTTTPTTTTPTTTTPTTTTPTTTTPTTTTPAPTTPKCASKCDAGWFYFNLSCYKKIDGPFTQTQAAGDCAELGATLASIDSKEENTAITNEYETTECDNSAWIGSGSNYTNWAPGKDTNCENCRVLALSEIDDGCDIICPGEWFQKQCQDIQNSAICEKKSCV